MEDYNIENDDSDSSVDSTELKKLCTVKNKTDKTDNAFEREMENELNQTLNSIEKNCEMKLHSTKLIAGSCEEEIKTSKASSVGVQNKDNNNDDFYDPLADDNDQEWVDNTRYHKYIANELKGELKVPHSDAVLDCPYCMTTLCRDCQRHAHYQSQYRAMFVQNCIVDFTKKLIFPLKNNVNNIHTTDDEFFPVLCEICGTQVAVYDVNEVYHFFHVLASH